MMAIKKYRSDLLSASALSFSSASRLSSPLTRRWASSAFWLGKMVSMNFSIYIQGQVRQEREGK